METRRSGHSARKQRREQRVRELKTAAWALAGEGGCGCHVLVGRQCSRRVPTQRLEMGKAASAMDLVNARAMSFTIAKPPEGLAITFNSRTPHSNRRNERANYCPNK